MTCAACATKVEKGIGKMDGVTNANVNLPLETVAVEYNNNEVDTTDMMNTVKKMGYDLRLAQDDKDKMDHKEQIGRASCRERVKNEEDGVGEKRKQEG